MTGKHTKGGPYTCVELCAGAGGQALGLEQAGFSHRTLVEVDPDACDTLRLNRPDWNVVRADLRETVAALRQYGDRPSLLAAGVPCPPFSLAGEQLGRADERDLFPAALAVISELRPRAVMMENVKGILQKKFAAYRAEIIAALSALGYFSEWKLLYARDFGVPQLRPRAVLVALEARAFDAFTWPATHPAHVPRLVGDVLHASMASRGWELADAWAAQARELAPTVCGGSRKHGGADLGPSRARQAWAEMGVNGSSVADEPPSAGDSLPVRLTVPQLALLQGFPPDWRFAGRKTSVYRQVGNAFPPPVARAVGQAIADALAQADQAGEDDTPHMGSAGGTLFGMTCMPSLLRSPEVSACPGTR
ncbi:DNA cytosine methyltransferase [Streptomyces sp. NPDC059517]|uniref:DNA cytosine methyltransferase n=1 Tax=Streptomyces sp. NPDC059517 TaxID=3346855 RepID=UPI0036BAE1F1